jgi:hypothetical protein
MKASELAEVLQKYPDLDVCFGEGQSVECVVDDLEGAIYLLEDIPYWPDCQFNQVFPDFIEFGEPNE